MLSLSTLQFSKNIKYRDLSVRLFLKEADFWLSGSPRQAIERILWDTDARIERIYADVASNAFKQVLPNEQTLLDRFQSEEQIKGKSVTP